MGKDQVTVAVQASGLTGPLYSPRLVVSLGVKDDLQELVVLTASSGMMREVQRFQAPKGPLHHSRALLWCAVVGDALYGHLCIASGIQGELEDLPISVRPPA